MSMMMIKVTRVRMIRTMIRTMMTAATTTTSGDDGS